LNKLPIYKKSDPDILISRYQGQYFIIKKREYPK